MLYADADEWTSATACQPHHDLNHVHYGGVMQSAVLQRMWESVSTRQVSAGTRHSLEMVLVNSFSDWILEGLNEEATGYWTPARV